MGATDSIFSLAMNWILESRGALFGANTCSPNLKKLSARILAIARICFL